MAYSRKVVVQSVVAILIVISFTVFAIMAPSRHERGERFMMLAALGTLVNVITLMRRKFKKENSVIEGETQG